MIEIGFKSGRTHVINICTSVSLSLLLGQAGVKVIFTQPITLQQTGDKHEKTAEKERRDEAD